MCLAALALNPHLPQAAPIAEAPHIPTSAIQAKFVDEMEENDDTGKTYKVSNQPDATRIPSQLALR